MANYEYFSERMSGKLPLDSETIGEKFWVGVVAVVENMIQRDYFAAEFPVYCDIRGLISGTHVLNLSRMLEAHIPDFSWESNFKNPNLPSNQNSIFDVIEFFYHRVLVPCGGSPYRCDHRHIENFDQDGARKEYREQINRLFERNRHPYELKDSGQVERIGPPILAEIVRRIQFHTGDADLNSLLESARAKFLDPELTVRKESLEKLWDAWERIKSLRNPNNKQDSIRKILNEVAPEANFCGRLNAEASELNAIGNNFMIRHTEVNKTPIQSVEQIDYLFHRMFSLIWLILKKLNLAG